MEHNRIGFLFIISVTVVLILFSCYPGMGPAGERDDKDPVVPGERIVVDAERSSIIIGKNDKFPIVALVENDGVADADHEITWASSAENIATVNSSGIVTGINLGDAAITITSKSGATAKVMIHVREIEVRPASGQITKDVGLQMEALILPGEELTDSKLTWTLSNNNAAITPAGFLSTTAETGQVDVVASSTYGNLTSGSANIDIVANTTSIVRIEEGSSRMMAVEETFQLTANLAGVTWNSSKDSVATVDSNGLITVVGLGDATITATSGGGATATFDVYARKLTIDNLGLELSAGDDTTVTATLSGGTTPVAATNLNWSVSGGGGLLTKVSISQDGVLSSQGLLGLDIVGVSTVLVTATVPSNPLLTDTKPIALVGVGLL